MRTFRTMFTLLFGAALLAASINTEALAKHKSHPAPAPAEAAPPGDSSAQTPPAPAPDPTPQAAPAKPKASMMDRANAAVGFFGAALAAVQTLKAAQAQLGQQAQPVQTAP